MLLRNINILNFRNLREVNLHFADKINCFVGLNGQGKTNLLDAIYYLSFTKSAFNVIDSQNIMHDQDFAMIQGEYEWENANMNEADDVTIETVTVGLKRGVKKQIRRGKKEYKRLIDHIGLIPLVIVSPDDQQLISDGSETRRKFVDGVISQYDKKYLEHLSEYNALLKQRNAMLKQYEEQPGSLPIDLMQILEMQMTLHAEYIFEQRTSFIGKFVMLFQDVYHHISAGNEQVTLQYMSQLQNRNLQEAYERTRQRDLILGWTSQGVHKDELEMHLGEFPIKQVASQGQQKTYLLALKLAQALYLNTQGEQMGNNTYKNRPILLLDDLFDRLDSQRVERIISLVQGEQFGQIFITDTDRQHLSEILRLQQNATIIDDSQPKSWRIFHVNSGQIQEIQ